MEDIPWLPKPTNELIARTVSALEAALGSNLCSAVLVGNAMNPARADRARGPEILAIVVPPLALTKLAERLHDPMTEGARVRVLTEDELVRSADVFALELAEWKARHRLLAGRDVLKDLTPTRAHLRHGIETELRGLTRRMRNRVLTGLATDSRRDDPFDGVVAGYDRLLVSAYHTLALLGDEPPQNEHGIVRAIATETGAEAAPFLEKLDALRHGGRFQPVAALEVLLTFAEPLIELVDSMELPA